jgi:metal-responsive CopG/Arc/MetJ family transcriptional regulator
VVSEDEPPLDYPKGMTQMITITLPADIQLALDELSQSEGVSRDEVVSRAVKQHLFLRRFRSLRERMAAKASNGGIVTDQDVFDQVS